MIYLYSFFLYLISPVLPMYLKYRGRKNPDYLLNWHERFGINLINKSSKPIIWLHSVSVGETRAMMELVKLLTKEYINYQLLITTMTPTGRKTAQNLFPNAIVHYIPYDLAFCVKKFYKNFKPELGVIMETEIWPNLIYYASKNNIPLYLANARLSNRSFNGYNRFRKFLLPVLNRLNGILCQEDNTYNNFKKLGYTGELIITGNTKFDLSLPDNYEKSLKELRVIFDDRKVICFASTRDGEEEIILNNIDFNLDVLYLIIPRHPERFSILEKLLKQKNISYIRRSDNNRVNYNTKVIIGDSMGEMLAYYTISYIVIMGGSLKGYGGQNPLEAFYMNKPVIFGNSMFNFQKISDDSLSDKCAIQIEKVDELSAVINRLVDNLTIYTEYNNNCDKFIKKYQGASQKIFDVIQECLNVSYETKVSGK